MAPVWKVPVYGARKPRACGFSFLTALAYLQACLIISKPEKGETVPRNRSPKKRPRDLTCSPEREGSSVVPHQSRASARNFGGALQSHRGPAQCSIDCLDGKRYH